MARLISDKYREVQRRRQDRFDRLKRGEEALNRAFIDIYGLRGELSPEVADRDVTVHRVVDAPDETERRMAYALSMREEIASLLSYIVGCVLGRYSPYVDGLLYAGGAWDASAIRARIEAGARACDWYDPDEGLFLPNRDGIATLTGDACFEADVVDRTVEFVRKVYGSETLEANLRFIADALGEPECSPREALRGYFMRDFYGEHLRTYRRRPVYWLLDSGRRGGFRALMYIHRWDEGTLDRLRADYVARLCDRLRGEARPDAREARRLEELLQYDERLRDLAGRHIALDPDDGVKANYAKLQDILARIK